ncbi:MAG: LysM peptidoglycan-binding domain-containing protein [Planctomycetota bacterium]
MKKRRKRSFTMTSDAKVGLLLGLVFIFIIAFLINGLPRFRSENNSELTTRMFNSQYDDFGLGGKERKTIEENNLLTGYGSEPSKGSDKSESRYEIPITKEIQAGKKILEEMETTVAGDLPALTDNEAPAASVKQKVLPKAYEVAAGENLSAIAKRFYGEEEGNRWVNVMRIFNANRTILTSADEVYEGQTIMIPPLPTMAQGAGKAKGILPAAMFNKVKSIGRTHLWTGRVKAKQGGQYVVRDGDSLWRIAAERLGDGSRYMEIANLNADVLEDENTLLVGMRLKLPGQ